MRPCPFCGCTESPVLVWQDKLNSSAVRACCANCDAMGPEVEFSQEASFIDEEAEKAAESALDLWNKRATET